MIQPFVDISLKKNSRLHENDIISHITNTTNIMKKLLTIIPLLFSLSMIGQRLAPRLDTTITGKVIFTDEKGIQYDVFRSDGGKSSIIKNGKQIALFRREPKVKLGASEFAKSN